MEHSLHLSKDQKVLIFMRQYKKEIMPYIYKNNDIRHMLVEKVFPWQRIAKKKRKLIVLKIEGKTYGQK
ncbi:MAG: hypothetical protein D6828_01130 [Nitrospirae bacterium]|nr:MAG: hypothetical protein D6828_01130 [Nitrospirota bacterium]